MERERARAFIRASTKQAAMAVAASQTMVREAGAMALGLQDEIEAAHERTVRASDRLRRLDDPPAIVG